MFQFFFIVLILIIQSQKQLISQFNGRIILIHKDTLYQDVLKMLINQIKLLKKRIFSSFRNFECYK